MKKKKILRKNSFQETSKDFIKNDFNLFSYKKEPISFIFNFKKVIYTYCIKRIYYKISIWAKKLFLLAFTIKE